MTAAHSVFVSDAVGSVPALLDVGNAPRAVLVLAHGAGAGMEHAFMARVAHDLAARGLAVWRYAFPYTAKGGRRPDPRPVLTATAAAAMAAAAARFPNLPLFAGGKSMGGRMTSGAVADGTAPAPRGLVFLGFPLHPPKKPGVARAEHLRDVPCPMLFFQGTRDALADLELLRPQTDALGARATLHICEGADHGFAVLKRSGRDAEAVFAELADTVTAWVDGICRTDGAHV